MTERKQREISQRRTSLGFVVMLLFSTLGVLATVPTSSANLTGSIGISGSASPTQMLGFPPLIPLTSKPR